MSTLIKELTVSGDLAVRESLETLAKKMRAKYPRSTWQGNFANGNASDVRTFGDRVQVGSTAVINGTRYLFVANVIIKRKEGGQTYLRITAWSLNGTGDLVGVTPLRTTKINGLKLTPSTGARFVMTMTAELPKAITGAKDNVKAKRLGRRVVAIHTDRNGENAYSTVESHVLCFGGEQSAIALLS